QLRTGWLTVLRIAANLPDRTDVVAAPARSKVADLLSHEVTDYRASTINALKAQTEEASRAACCHRPGEQGIADLHSSTGRDNSRGAKTPDPEADRACCDVGAKPRRDGDVGRSVPDRRCCDRGGTSGAGR